MNNTKIEKQELQDINVHESIRNFSYISDVFKHIEGFHLMGHQIGRKVGDMLELVVMAKVFSEPELRSRVVYEPKIEGITGAGHKVEFGFYEKSDEGIINVPFGFIECKRVGVEVTKDSSIKSAFLKLKIDDELKINLSSAWLNRPIQFRLKVENVINDRVFATASSNISESKKIELTPKSRVVLVVDEHNIIYIISPHENLRNISNIIRICKIITLEDVQSDVAIFGMYDCLTGPQTIEKAKQAAFVAMDVRRKVDGKWGVWKI